jgi:hypothetical protein
MKVVVKQRYKKKPRSENERAEDEERRGNEGGRLSRD